MLVSTQCDELCNGIYFDSGNKGVLLQWGWLNITFILCCRRWYTNTGGERLWSVGTMRYDFSKQVVKHRFGQPVVIFSFFFFQVRRGGSLKRKLIKVRIGYSMRGWHILYFSTLKG